MLARRRVNRARCCICRRCKCSPRNWDVAGSANCSFSPLLDTGPNSDQLQNLMIRKSRFQTLRPACVRFRRMRPRSVQQSLGCWFHRDRRRHWARCPIVLLPPDLPGRHAAYAEQTASPRTFLEMQSTWRTSQCPAGVATGHEADKLQTGVPNAGLGSRRAQSPFSPSYLSTKYPQAAFHSLDHVSRSDGTNAHTVCGEHRLARLASLCKLASHPGDIGTSAEGPCGVAATLADRPDRRCRDALQVQP